MMSMCMRDERKGTPMSFVSTHIARKHVRCLSQEVSMRSLSIMGCLGGYARSYVPDGEADAGPVSDSAVLRGACTAVSAAPTGPKPVEGRRRREKASKAAHMPSTCANERCGYTWQPLHPHTLMMVRERLSPTHVYSHRAHPQSRL